VPGAPGRYRFRHDLIRVVVDEQLGGMRRARLHLRVGRTLEAMTIERPPEQLARHFVAALPAGGADKAIEWLTEAGRAALAVFAYEQAAEHCNRALEVLDEVAPNDSDRRCRLQLDLDQVLAHSVDAPSSR
jgi:predicted ATPase